MRCLYIFLLLQACKKSDNASTQPVTPQNMTVVTYTINGSNPGSNIYNINAIPVIKIQLSSKVNRQTTAGAFSLKDAYGSLVSTTLSYENNDSTIVAQPASALHYLSTYAVSLSTALKSASGGSLTSGVDFHFVTQIDSTDKFPRITDSALLDLVQQQTFKYFWDFGHPICGMARERNTSGDVVTTGGTGFGIMGMVAAVNRGFITRTDGLNRITTITNFLLTKAQRWHGAFAHWINGTTGAIVPFGNNNGADIVETSYLVAGLLCARQYFNTTAPAEAALRDSINSLWNTVEWNWFTQNGAQQSLYWQYNPSYTNTSDIWSIAVTGWNEALITYVLSASSATHGITKAVYDNGWAKNGAMKNGAAYYGVTLPLGPSMGGPLFFAHYSFLGINPNGLSDTYANYWQQNVAHSQINYNYCVADPLGYNGYSTSCWGLTASDIANGYTASSPTNDGGYIAPTAAISSLPYTPVQSMNALRFFYYKLGDKIWGQYGFTDAFNLNTLWYASSYLAIDQGPEIVMIENYRTGLLWNLFTSCPEVKTGLKNLGFTAPYL
ncbi:MAG: Ig-like domain-containing protein [Bacteroidota bacterium]|nr:Ig-like domain-containing protein [Bacteroidota bacterium]